MIDVQDLDAKLARLEETLEETLAATIALLDTHESEVVVLVAKAKHLVEMLDDAEVNHGGLIGTVTLRAKNELRLELSRWSLK